MFSKIFKKNKPLRLDLHESVVQNSIKQDYIKTDCIITATNREILIDWLISVVFKISRFKFKDDLIDSTVNLIDRYIAHPESKVDRKNLQLVGIACLSIASKFWEHIEHTLTEHELVYITSHTFTIPQLLDMEKDILRKLDYKIWNYSIHFYIDQYNNYLEKDISKKTLELTKYALMCYEMVTYKPSEVAAGIMYSIDKEWTGKLTDLSGSCQGTAEKISTILNDYRSDILKKEKLIAIKEL